MAVIIEGFLRAGKKVNKAIYNDMHARGIQPTSVTVGIIVQPCANERSEEREWIADHFVHSLLSGKGGRGSGPPPECMCGPLMWISAARGSRTAHAHTGHAHGRADRAERRRCAPGRHANIPCLKLSMCIAAHDGENERAASVGAGRVCADGNIAHRISRRAKAIEITTLIPAVSRTALPPSTRLPLYFPASLTKAHTLQALSHEAHVG